TLPVVVIGVGLRAPFAPKLNEGFPIDQDVKAFVSAVLERSNMIGVRVEITAKYLSRLGFREGIDHTVIGCPSMYAYVRE
ncbi:polysaccharide pyruvyl transferase family protein, partial [Bacillus spizizenii]|nr:polysaccharide pyruvyl transferase family protein [Bacillus spizizenii]